MEKSKTHRFTRWGRVLAETRDGNDYIAKGLLDGDIFDNRSADEATGAQLMLVPAPFSLTCNGVNGQFACSEIDGIDTREQAVLAGWQNIQFEPFEMGANYVGICLRCQKAEN